LKHILASSFMVFLLSISLLSTATVVHLRLQLAILME
jgi:hypothetical protein